MAVTNLINPDHIKEALSLFNGYWANDYTMCDMIADKYNYNRKAFTKEVYNNFTLN